MKVCIIDIGSNTIKASIFEILDKNVKKEIGYKGSKEQLITCVDDNKVMSDEGIFKLDKSIHSLTEFALEYSCDKIFAFATASLRGVKNSKEILNFINDKYSLNIDILSAEEEAMCSLKGLLSELEENRENSGIMIDMGGGSTEIVYFKEGETPFIKSLNFGCLSLSENGLIKKEATDIIKNELAKCDFAKNIGCPLYLIGGTARAILKLSKERKGVDIYQLNRDGEDFSYLVKNICTPDVLEFVKNTVPSRAQTVFSGALAYVKLIELINPSAIFVSDSGVRDGYLERILY